MEYMGVSRIITLDIHSREIENSFNKLRLENLHASYQIIRELSRITDITSDKLVVVAPDTGAVTRNKFLRLHHEAAPGPCSTRSATTPRCQGTPTSPISPT
jgi:phosphoribosylpyrophosphate synthetase